MYRGKLGIQLLCRLLLISFSTAVLAGLLTSACFFIGHKAVVPSILHAEEYEVFEFGNWTETEEEEEWGPEDGRERTGFTVMSNLIICLAYSLIVTSGYTIQGTNLSLREGLQWGLAGWFTFQLGPALGLSPELPGMLAADLDGRQAWWWACVVSTGVGLAVLRLSLQPRSLVASRTSARVAGGVLGALLVLLPHIIGAPHPDIGLEQNVPAELAAGFAVTSLVTVLVSWLLIGGLSGWLCGQLIEFEPLLSSMPTATSTTI